MLRELNQVKFVIFRGLKNWSEPLKIWAHTSEEMFTARMFLSLKNIIYASRKKICMLNVKGT